MQSRKRKLTFIIKPDAGCQGKGLILLQDPDVAAQYSNSAVCQIIYHYILSII
jgi:hypothetical protein